MRFPKIALLRSVAVLGLAVLAVLSGFAPAGDGPVWWNVRIRIELWGRYAVTRNATDVAGEYAYEAVWTGSLEKDDVDYLLYHASFETVRWEMKERSGRDADAKLLSEKDLPVRPAFRMNYVLGEKGRLRFFFIVEGFPVPLSDVPEKFVLVLPCSRSEFSDSYAAGYDDAVTEGSNDVSLDEKDLRKGPSNHVFRWAWKCYQPSSAPPPAGPLFNSHETKVTLTITPHALG